MTPRSSVPFLVVVSGPSGVGKTTLIDRLLATDSLTRRCVTATTRAPRNGENEGEHYFFVSRDRFEAMKAGELVEWAEVHGESYGVPRAYLDKQRAAGFDVVLNIDIQGGDRVKQVFPDALMVFILPPTFDALEARLRGRGDLPAEDFAVRLANARTELAAASRYEYLVVNDDLDRAARELGAIVVAERARRVRKVDGFAGRTDR
ncbi:MAG: guanylate kinase [Candidatus Krumholzibacteria bacterium]|nr:guanylate kinase [Candidatus Krumholzibacteria bacterium]MDH4338251.1 guanylate kinase [Candidatus Krumholzibacteria bacterium]MDH5270540.1 guanylate kinase [Candidatus Krumholzibacteria bacterium]